MSRAACSGECVCGGSATQPIQAGVSRRGVLVGSAAVAASLALAACGAPTEAEPTTPTTTTPTPTQTSESAGPTPGDDESTPASGGEALTETTAFPTGGGAIVRSSVGMVVVTQPADGEFKAFNARCPHAGCTVAEVKENVIECPCHGSTFDAASGAHLEGPAPTGLTPVAVTVSGDQVLLA